MNHSYRWMVGGCAVVLMFLAGNADAANREWKGAVYYNGTYNLGDPLHWDGGVPDNTDVAIFTGAGTNAIPDNSVFTVQLPGNATVSTFHARDGQYELTFDLGAYTFSTQDTANTAMPYIQGPGTGVVINLMGSGTASWTNFRMGFDANTAGTINLDGASTLSIKGSSTITIGGSGSGTLNMTGGAKLTSTQTPSLGSLSSGTGTGTWNLSGNSTTATVGNHVFVGDYGSAALVVEDGAQLINNGGNNYILFGQRGGSGQTVTALITGAGSLVRSNVTSTLRGIVLGGNIDSATVLRTAGTVHVTVADQGRMESNRMIAVYGRHTLEVDNGTVTAGTHLVAADGSKFAFTLYNANRDALIQAGGDVTIGNNVEVTLSLGTGSSFAYGQFVELIQYGGTRTGTFKDIAENDEFTLGAYDFRFTYVGGAGNDTIGLTVIPEPGSLALALLGLGGLAVRRRFV